MIIDSGELKRDSANNGDTEEPGRACRPSEIINAAQEFINYLQVERGLSANTIKAYRHNIARYVEYLHREGIEKPGDVTAGVLAGFAGELKSKGGAGLSPGSIAQALSSVRGFHEFLFIEGYTGEDPSTVLVTPRAKKRLPRALSRVQVEKLLDAPSGGDLKGVRDRLILETLYATGMRISELVGLDLEDIDLEERSIRCRGKGDKWRIVPFGRTTAEVLGEYLDEVRPELAKGKGSGALILNMRGGRLTRQGSWKIIRGYAKATGLERVVTPHVLRHTFATHLLEGGASLLVVQELLGHASLSTTQIYTQVTPKHLKEVYCRSHPRA